MQIFIHDKKLKQNNCCHQCASEEGKAEYEKFQENPSNITDQTKSNMHPDLVDSLSSCEWKPQEFVQMWQGDPFNAFNSSLKTLTILQM